MKYCLNCDTPFSPADSYCNICGQKTNVSKLNLTNIVKDFFANFFNIENKIWRTVIDIWIPGKLTSSYVAGRRINYYNPIRVFIVVLFLFFALTVIHLGRAIVGVDKFATQNQELVWEGKMKQKFDSLAVLHPALNDSTIQASLFEQSDQGFTTSHLDDEHLAKLKEIVLKENHQPAKRNRELLDSLIREQGSFNYELGKRDFTDTMRIPGLSSGYYSEGTTFNQSEFFNLSAEELKDRHGRGNKYLEFLIAQVHKMIFNLQSSVTFMVGNGTWAVILQVLLMGLLFKLLYIRRGYVYAEHFIFHTYGHTRILLVGLLFQLAALVFPLGMAAGPFIMLWLLLGGLYLYLCMKAYYKQSRSKTILKWLMTLLSYVVGLVICSVFILIFSVFLL